MKKIVSIFLLIISLFIISGCDSKEFDFNFENETVNTEAEMLTLLDNYKDLIEPIYLENQLIPNNIDYSTEVYKTDFEHNYYYYNYFNEMDALSLFLSNYEKVYRVANDQDIIEGEMHTYTFSSVYEIKLLIKQEEDKLFINIFTYNPLDENITSEVQLYLNTIKDKIYLMSNNLFYDIESSSYQVLTQKIFYEDHFSASYSYNENGAFEYKYFDVAHKESILYLKNDAINYNVLGYFNYDKNYIYEVYSSEENNYKNITYLDEDTTYICNFKENDSNGDITYNIRYNLLKVDGWDYFIKRGTSYEYDLYHNDTIIEGDYLVTSGSYSPFLYMNFEETLDENDFNLSQLGLSFDLAYEDLINDFNYSNDNLSKFRENYKLPVDLTQALEYIKSVITYKDNSQIFNELY